MRREILLKATSLNELQKLEHSRSRDLKLAIILILKLILIALPASFFLFSCATGQVNPIPQIPIKLYSVKPDGLHRKGEVTPFDEKKPFIGISPEDFGELLTRCPTE